MTKPNRPTFALTLRAELGDPRPAITRVRALLKFALRALGLRCLTIHEITSPPPDTESEGV